MVKQITIDPGTVEDMGVAFYGTCVFQREGKLGRCAYVHVVYSSVRLGKCVRQIVAAPLAQLASVDFGPPLHSLILAGDTHVVEEELLAHFRLPGARQGRPGS